jgi:ankyrin repeat protein
MKTEAKESLKTNTGAIDNTIEDIKKILIESDFIKFKNALSEYNIHEHDKFGNNLLHYYLNFINTSKGEKKFDWKKVINELINKGLDINEKQISGTFQRSPLQMSVVFNLKDVFNFLINKGVDVHSTDANGNNILLSAVFNYLKDKESYGYYIKELLKVGANPFMRNNHEVSAYSLANNIEDNEVLKYFEGLANNVATPHCSAHFVHD